jgi:hypothetical protein
MTVRALVLFTALRLGHPGLAAASMAIVPDDYATIQLGIDSGADTIVVRAGTYAENVLLVTDGRPVVLMADPAASPRPTLQGLIVKANHSYEGDRKVVGLRILNPVDLQTGSVSARYDFEACRFEAGVKHLLGQPEYSHAGEATTFLRCTMRGNTYLFVNSLSMESDTVEAGGASFSAGGGAVRVRNSWFRGPSGLYVTNTSPLSAEVLGNRFENCAVGIHVYDDFSSSSIVVESNEVRNSRDWGIRVLGEYLDILRNDVRDSGGGIDANVRGNLHLIGNTVIRGSRAGISLYEDAPGSIEVRENLVLKCGGTGIAFVGSDYIERSFTGNTSALNSGSGLSIAINRTYGETPGYRVANNIAIGNAGWGLHWSWSGTGMPALSCNDWFGNTAGSTYGVAPGAADLSADPIFCDVSHDDLSLRGNSPLLGGTCGTIGARGFGCHAPTVLYLASFGAEIFEQGVCVRWRLGGDGVEEPVSVCVERSAGPLGPWQPLTTDRFPDGDDTLDWDRAPVDRAWYRLAWTSLDGQAWRSSPVQAEIARTAAAFTLRAVGPTPSSGSVSIEYTLQRSAVVALTVHDIMGRELARLANGYQTQGLHTVTWKGEAHGKRVGPGVYFVRLRWPEGTQSRRILVRR